MKLFTIFSNSNIQSLSTLLLSNNEFNEQYNYVLPTSNILSDIDLFIFTPTNTTDFIINNTLKKQQP